VFLIGFTLIFILSVAYHLEPLVWPGGAFSIVAGFGVLRVLSKRERRAKIREVDGE
jgi:Flp pilus assembly protein TadB